ncbi:hypothetical protein NDU88_000955 [Pleurodeles waltl]|uniref:Uncharacterized protein n=1 Tax=Pleurodeles waltl TaxID=8319 RepID=A0AAV7SY31_PLEWA|nr:hypothetical protein NDU88_000955 [Pleurodeles waltl]
MGPSSRQTGLLLEIPSCPSSDSRKMAARWRCGHDPRSADKPRLLPSLFLGCPCHLRGSRHSAMSGRVGLKLQAAGTRLALPVWQRGSSQRGSSPLIAATRLGQRSGGGASCVAAGGQLQGHAEAAGRHRGA